MNPGARRGYFEQCGDRIAALGVRDGASKLALPTSYASLRIDEYSIHHTLAPIIDGI
jgi:hypothetical protein